MYTIAMGDFPTYLITMHKFEGLYIEDILLMSHAVLEGI